MRILTVAWLTRSPREGIMNRRFTIKKAVASGTLVLAGIGVGAVVASNGSASATDGSATSTSDSTDQSKSVRPDEELLTGETASKVEAAALAKYPGATIERVETDSDGVYEAHIITTDGAELIVQVGKDFAVTGTDTRGGGHDGDTSDDTTG